MKWDIQISHFYRAPELELPMLINIGIHFQSSQSYQQWLSPLKHQLISRF